MHRADLYSPRQQLSVPGLSDLSQPFLFSGKLTFHVCLLEEQISGSNILKISQFNISKKSAAIFNVSHSQGLEIHVSPVTLNG